MSIGKGPNDSVDFISCSRKGQLVICSINANKDIGLNNVGANDISSQSEYFVQLRDHEIIQSITHAGFY